MRLCELDSAGKDTSDARLRSAGFEIGQNVLRKSDSATAKIQAMSATEVTLLVNKSVVKVAAKQFLAGDWKPFTAKAEALPVPFVGSLPVNSPEFEIARWKAQVLNQISADEATGAKHYAGLQVFLKPSKDVRSAKKFEKGALNIVPSTHRVDLKAAGSTSGSAISCGTTDIKGNVFDIFLSSCLQQGDQQVIHPFWVMRTSANLADCNMELVPKNHAARKLTMKASGAWHVPMARNTKVINPGESLILYKAATAAMPEPLVPEKPEKKKARKG